MKERYFWVAIGLIAISWIVNSVYAHSKQLEEPIFLDHYIEMTMDQKTVTLYYLANKNDDSYVRHIYLGNIEGFPQHAFIYPDEKPHVFDTYKHQELRSILIELRQINDQNVERSFNEMQVYYSDGKASTVSIGEIIIRPEGYFESDNPRPLVLTSGGGRNDGQSAHSFLVNEPLSIQKISGPFNNTLGNELNLSLTGSNVQIDKKTDGIELPIHLDKGESLTVGLDQTSTSKPTSFFISLSGTTAAGAPFKSHGGFHSNEPSLTQEDVNRIIKEKTGRESGE